MKIITQYECEICGKRHFDEEAVIECESQGAFDGSEYPAGLMFPYFHSRLIGIFAFPKPPRPLTSDKHIGMSSYWACRVSGGDSLGDEVCGGDYFRSNPEDFKRWLTVYHMKKDNTECDEFKRMVEYLKSVNIQPSYYDETGKLHLV